MNTKSLSLSALPKKATVISILLVSVVMRWVLVLRGGQYYFPDEQRYETSRNVIHDLFLGNLREAILQLFAAPEHLGFKVLGIIPAFLEHFIGPRLVLPAMFFSLFSVLNLYLIFLLSQRISGSYYEALAALMFSVLSQTLFYYSRHLMPYDAAMSFGMLSLYVGLSNRSPFKTSVACGVFGLLCFITYNGYWALAGLAMLVHGIRNNKTFFDFVRKSFFLAVGFILPIIGLIALANQLGVNLLSAYLVFARTITEGTYQEGWILPFAYFWYSEYFLFIALCVFSAFAVFNLKNHRTEGTLLWGSCIMFIYLCLAIPSVFLHSFVVYGRLARQIMPFIILLAANGFIQLAQSGLANYRLIRVALILVFVQAVWNFNVSYHVAYPRDFVKDVQAQYKDFSFSSKRFAFGAPTLCENNGYAMQNAKYFPYDPETAPSIPGTVLMSAMHPINFLPYQYEGYTPRQRQAFRDAHLVMIFYRIDPDFASKNDLRKIGIKSCLPS
jgi:hypothetical protein